jgi:copper resistance protein B
MSSFRTLLTTAVALVLLTAPALAQHAGHTDTPAASAPSAPTVPGAVDFGQPVDDQMIFAHGILDQFEGRVGSGGRPEFRWDGQAWIGTDYDKLWLKSEGLLRKDGSLDDGRHQFLYSRAISTFFDLQAGLRSDIDSRPSRQWAALGIQGLAPLFFNVEATAYASDQGHFSARLVGSYDLLLTQRLILQPEIEMNFESKADPKRLIGAGLSEIDAGLRLRYEIDRKFAPYIGIAFRDNFGQTAKFGRQAGESTNDVRFTVGIRSWF